MLWFFWNGDDPDEQLEAFLALNMLMTEKLHTIELSTQLT